MDKQLYQKKFIRIKRVFYLSYWEIVHHKCIFTNTNSQKTQSFYFSLLWHTRQLVWEFCIVKRYWWGLHVIVIHKVRLDWSWLGGCFQDEIFVVVIMNSLQKIGNNKRMLPIAFWILSGLGWTSFFTVPLEDQRYKTSSKADNQTNNLPCKGFDLFRRLLLCFFQSYLWFSGERRGYTIWWKRLRKSRKSYF